MPKPPQCALPQSKTAHPLKEILPSGNSGSFLSEDDIVILQDALARGMGTNSLRALTSDLAYIEAWCLAATASPLPWPAPLDLVLKFLAHHSPGDPAVDRNPMPDDVRAALRAEGRLRSVGPHRRTTVRRRLSSWSTWHRWRNVEGPFQSEALRKALRVLARGDTRRPQRKSKTAVTAELIEKMLVVLENECRDGARTPTGLRALRDRALLSVGFAGGGRRRSEVAALSVPALTWLRDSQGVLQGLRWYLGVTKTTQAEDDAAVLIRGRPAHFVQDWLTAAQIGQGAVFRRIDRWGHIGTQALEPGTVSAIVKARAAQAGIDPAKVSAHGLRSGFMTSASDAGLALPEAMAQSKHRSVQTAARYYDQAAGAGKATRLLE